MPATAKQVNRLPTPPRSAAGAIACAGAIAVAALATSLLPASAQDVAVGKGAAVLRYRVVNLGAGDLASLPQINTSGQVAFALSDGQSFIASFFDGKRVRDIGSLGGALAITTGINDSGQISGYSSGAPDAPYHAFRWSAGSGMLDLGTIDGGESVGLALNAKGVVVGYSGGALRAPHAFRWTANAGMEDLGSLADDLSSAVALNDNGLVAGFSNTASFGTHAFVWARGTGIVDIGTLGGTASYPQAVASRGEVAGYSELGSAPGRYHAFLWTKAAGMRDLGALNGTESFALAMSPQARIAGVINVDSGYQRAMSWTAATGMVDLGTFGGPGARAQQVNGKDQVVGYALDKTLNPRAFLWSASQGLADLNPRLVNAPAGLVLDAAVAISDNGAIVATSNAGLVLLRPVGQDAIAAPVVGPIAAPALVRAGTAVTLKVAFNDIDAKELHRASLQWGDATMETARVTEKGGSGSVAASHVYSEPGVYTIIATVTDAAGNATKVKRELVVEAAGLRAAGSGRLLVPHGANRLAPAEAGPASFSFIAPGAQAAAGKLGFNSARLNFRSTAMSAAARVQGSQPGTQQLSGTGKLNGKDGYRYALTVSAGAPTATSAPATAPSARFGLRIWHSDPVTQADVVDFDNQPVQAAVGGTALVEGAIAVAP